MLRIRAAFPVLASVLILSCSIVTAWQHPWIIRKRDGDKISRVTTTECPYGCTVVDGACLRVYPVDFANRAASEAKCKLQKPATELAMIDTADKNDWVLKQLHYNDYSQATIGAAWNPNKKVLTWSFSKGNGFIHSQWHNFSKTPITFATHVAVSAEDGKWQSINPTTSARFSNHAVVCELPIVYPVNHKYPQREYQNYCPTHVSYEREFDYVFFQGICLRVPNQFHESILKRGKHAENAREFKSAQDKCKATNFYGVLAVLDTPEKNMFARTLISRTRFHAANGWVNIQNGVWGYDPDTANKSYRNWADDVGTGGCVQLLQGTGKWRKENCDVQEEARQGLPICQKDIYPVCYMPNYIENGKITVKERYRKISVDCNTGTKREGPENDLYCRNTRYGTGFPSVKCVPDTSHPQPKYFDKFDCKDNRFLALPSNFTPYTIVPSFHYANKSCKESYMDVPADVDYPCLVDFLKAEGQKFLGYFNITTGVWFSAIGHSKPFRWLDRTRNTRGFATTKEMNPGNRIICVGTTDFPHQGGGDLEYHCSGMTLKFPGQMEPNINMQAFSKANDTCAEHNLAVPDHTAVNCLKAFVKHIKPDSRFADYVSDKNGPWLHNNDGTASAPYAWMDRNGNIKGYGHPKKRHDRNHIICMQKHPKDTGSAWTSTASTITGSVVGAVVFIGVVFVAYRRCQVSAASNSAGRISASAAGRGVNRRSSQQELVASQYANRRTSDHSLGGGEVGNGSAPTNGPKKYYYGK